jgi:hypothetical protein
VRRWWRVRVLLDECLPVGLEREISRHEVSTVSGVGWAGTRNGELLRRCAAAYEVFITIDQRLLSQGVLPPGLAIVTLKARSNRLEDLRPLIPSLLAILESIKSGETVRIS